MQKNFFLYLSLTFLLLSCSCNFIQNGDFTQPPLHSGWRILKSLPGWQIREIEQGIGNIYNHRWGNRVIIQLDGNTNDHLIQRVHLNPGAYEIEFQYAARSGWVKSSAMGVLWNGALVRSVTSNDEEIYVFKEKVLAKAGVNTLQIVGQGDANSYGMGITGVKLTSAQIIVVPPRPQPVPVVPARNLLVNPDFELPARKQGWSIIHRLPGWHITEIEQGVGKIYNHRWGNKVVLELDGNQNNAITQTLHLGAGIYSFEVAYAARSGSVATSGLQVAINGEVFQRIIPQDDQIRKLSFNIQVREPGQFDFCVSGIGASDSYGMTLGYVALSPVFGVVSGRTRLCLPKK